MTQDNNLPFELSEQAITDWLEGLSQFNVISLADQLNRVLKQLQRNTANSQIILPLLIHLTPTIFHTADAFKDALFAHASEHSKGTQPKLPRLCIQLFRGLSLAFCQQIDKGQLNDTQKPIAAFYALQAAGFCFYTCALFKEPPSTTLWLKSGELYWIYASKPVFKQTLPVKFTEFNTEATLEAAIKRNLLFAIIEPYCCTPAEIDILFQWVSQNYQSLALRSEPTVTTRTIWDITRGIPHINERLNIASRYKLISLDTQALLPALELHQNTDNAPPIHLRQHLNAQLSGYKSTLQKAFKPVQEMASLINGFKNTLDFLEKRAKLDKIRRISDYTEPKSAPSIGLVPINKGKDPFSSHSRTLPYLKPAQLSSSIHEPQFTLAKIETDENYLIGDLVIILLSDDSWALAVNRQQINNPSLGVSHLLLEKLATSAEVHISKEPTLEGIPVIVTNHKEALLMYEKFAVGQTLHCQNNVTLTLNGLCEFTPFFARFQLSFDS